MGKLVSLEEKTTYRPSGLMDGCSVVAVDGVGLPLASCEISVFAVHVVDAGVQLASRKKIWLEELLFRPATLDEELEYAK